MAKTRTKKVWSFRTYESRSLAAELNKLSEQGEVVFSAYPSGNVSGSFDVLTYHNVEVKVESLATGTISGGPLRRVPASELAVEKPSAKAE
jgi:hypothetical protein